MEFSDVVEKRRSVRKFAADSVPETVIERALSDAVKAPNSSNMQQWEFYWVRSPEKKAKLVEACFSQPAAKTAAELIVAVARIDTWKRNRQLMLEALEALPKAPRSAWHYYRKIVPMNYRLGPLSVLGRCIGLVMNLVGLFRPVPRGPFTKKELSLIAVKSTALACENLMLSIVDQGYACCPMEGHDECRVAQIVDVPRSARVVMVIGIGAADPTGIYSPRIRFDSQLFFKKI
jgi:nitroreductase